VSVLAPGLRRARRTGATAEGCPIDIGAYDRTPELSAAELIALAELVPAIQRCFRWPSDLNPILMRLFEPVQAVLNLVDARGKPRAGSLRIVATATLQRRRTLWAWTNAEWVETLGGGQLGFRERHRVHDRCRQDMLAIACLLVGFNDWPAVGRVERVTLACNAFGRKQVTAAIETVTDVLRGWGYRPTSLKDVRQALCTALLANRSPVLADLTPELLEQLRAGTLIGRAGSGYLPLSLALTELGIHEAPLAPPWYRGHEPPPTSTDAVAEEWLHWCRRWYTTSTLRLDTRDNHYVLLLKVGRWLAAEHPDQASPDSWTRELAAEFVAVVSRMVVGQWSVPYRLQAKRVGQPLTACSKSGQLSAVRVFFRDCQDWGWLPRRFDPRRVLATPRSLLSLMGPNPRVVADDVWAKLVWAGLNLTADDLIGPDDGQRGWYPFEMVRALAVVWLFAGLRNDELRRLRVGCIRWQEPRPDAGTSRPICLLDVPANKTGPAFTKPVDRLVGEAVTSWAAVRHEQPLMVDRTTGELMSCLFAHRGQRVGQPYVNKTLIPILCHKAGIPEADARGTITSHRARATIATQLFNAKQPLTLFELQAWLGHRSPSSTQHYAKLSPTKLARAYADADYFARNVRTIDVLIDQDAISSGAAATGQPWRLYDLGHGYCSYQFFEQCPHRMACAKCSFYIVKGSARAQLLEGKDNLLKMLQEIPLTDGERDAVEEGVTAFDRLLENLVDVSTPGGPTPRQLTSERIGGSDP